MFMSTLIKAPRICIYVCKYYDVFKCMYLKLKSRNILLLNETMHKQSYITFIKAEMIYSSCLNAEWIAYFHSRQLITISRVLQLAPLHIIEQIWRCHPSRIKRFVSMINVSYVYLSINYDE